MWGTNTAPNIDECWLFNPKNFTIATSSPLQSFLDLVNHLLINMILPAMITNTSHLNM
jgi:hypothetical protein